MKEITVKDLLVTLTKLLNEDSIKESDTLLLTHGNTIIIKEANNPLIAFTQRKD